MQHKFRVGSYRVAIVIVENNINWLNLLTLASIVRTLYFHREEFPPVNLPRPSSSYSFKLRGYADIHRSITARIDEKDPLNYKKWYTLFSETMSTQELSAVWTCQWLAVWYTWCFELSNQKDHILYEIPPEKSNNFIHWTNHTAVTSQQF